MKYALVSFIALALIGFTAHATLETQRPDDSGTPVPITPLAPKPCPTCEQTRFSFMSYSAIVEPLQAVIKEGDSWKQMWDKIHCKVISPVPPLPEIDFSREMLVVVGLGARSSGGYGIVIHSAFEKDGKLAIIVRKLKPGKNCFTTQALTQPVDIVRLPKTDKQVEFREFEVVHECK